jgi:hypothetical protein
MNTLHKNLGTKTHFTHKTLTHNNLTCTTTLCGRFRGREVAHKDLAQQNSVVLLHALRVLLTHNDLASLLFVWQIPW